MFYFIVVGSVSGLCSGVFVLVVKNVAKVRSRYFPANSRNTTTLSVPQLLSAVSQC